MGNDSNTGHRQQTRHFGIENNTIAGQVGANRKRSIATTSTAATSVTDAIEAADDNTTTITEMQPITDDDDDNDDIDNGNDEFALSTNDVIDFDRITTSPADHHMELSELEDIIPFTLVAHSLQTTSLERIKRGASAQLNNVVHRVSVLVHNITLVSEMNEPHPDNQVESLIQR